MGKVCSRCCPVDPIDLPKVPRLKVLVLGAGESGKTTLIRQLDLLQDKQENANQGFSESRKIAARSNILSNLVEGAYRLLQHGRYSKDRMTDDKSIAAYKEVVAFYKGHLDPLVSADDPSVTPQSIKELSDDVAFALVQLAGDKNFLNTLREASKLQIPDGWVYFMEKIKNYPKWGGPKWTPSDEDVLHVRVRTLGISPHRLTIHGKNYEVFDVGGQQVERRKWLTQFFEVDVLIWMQSLSDYDEVMWENDNLNRFQDSLQIFEKMVNITDDKWNKEPNTQPKFTFQDSAIIIFLNKEDLCRKKFCEWRIPINPELGTKDNPVPVYNEELDDNQNLKAIRQWYADMLNEKFKIPNKVVNIHPLTALKQDTVERLIEAVFTENFIRVFESVA